MEARSMSLEYYLFGILGALKRIMQKCSWCWKDKQLRIRWLLRKIMGRSDAPCKCHHICDFTFFSSYIKNKIRFLIYFILSSMSKVFPCNRYSTSQRIINETFYILCFVLSLWNHVCILHLVPVSIWTSHISGAPWAHVASGSWVGQWQV